jgi:hypothetical protein
MTDYTQTKRIPAWKRLGLKLAKNDNSKKELDSNEKTSEPSSSQGASSSLFNLKTDSSHSALKKRKYVAFTEDTKVEDGNRSRNELRRFFASQNGGPNELTKQEIAKFSFFDSHHGDQSLPKTDSSLLTKVETAKPNTNTTARKKKSKKSRKSAGNAPSGLNEPPVYLAYIRQFHGDRSNWKFNSNKQNRIIRHAFNMSLIPPEDEMALLAYCKSIKSESSRQRLLTEAGAILNEDEGRAAKARIRALKQDIFEEKIRQRENDDRVDIGTEKFELKRKRAQSIFDWQGSVWKTSSSTASKAPVEVLSDGKAPINSVYSMVVNKETTDAAGNPIRKRRRIMVRRKKARTGLLDDDIESVSSVNSDDAAKLAGLESNEDSGSDGESDNKSDGSGADSSDDSDPSMAESSKKTSTSASSSDVSSNDDGSSQATSESDEDLD